MAISVSGAYTSPSAIGYQPGTSFNATTAFTPPNNCLLVATVVIASVDATANYTNSITPSLSGGGLTWTRRLVSTGTAGGYTSINVIFTAEVTTGASTTLSISGLPGNSGTFSHGMFEVVSVTGYNTSSFIGTTATGTNTSTGSYSITLSGNPASTSAVIATSVWTPNGSGGTTEPGSGWTEIYDYHTNGATVISGDLQYLIGLGSTSVPWTSITGDSPVSAAQAAIEILAAGSTPRSLPPPQSRLKFFNRRPF